MTDGNSNRLGIALSGGGARGAYQVGMLRFLARKLPDLRVPVLTGVSAGAINAAILAGYRGRFVQAVAHLSSEWEALRTQRVFASNAISLSGMLLRWGTRLVAGGSPVSPPTRGLVDTKPLYATLCDALCSPRGAHGALPGIEQNFAEGKLDALGITTTNYATGQSVTWCQGQNLSMWRRPHRLSVEAPITVEHVLASASLPLFFPAVRIGRDWHGDGGVGLTAPLSPALHLGADRVLAVSTRYQRTFDEADRPATDGYPPPAQILGVLMNAVFLDMLDFDALQMERVNRLLARLPPAERDGLRPVRLLVLRPSEDLGVLAGRYEPRLPGSLRFFLRGLGTHETKRSDSLSMIMFERDYISRLMDLGEADAEKQGDVLLKFVTG
jgi:NTE family protein